MRSSSREDFQIVEELIVGFINVKETAAVNQPVLNSGVDDKLDSFLELRKRLPEIFVLLPINFYLQEEVIKRLTLPGCIKSEFSVSYFQQAGYLIYTTASTQFDCKRYGFELLFVADGATYYKCNEMIGKAECFSFAVDLDYQYGNIEGKIADITIEIVQALKEKIIEYKECFFAVLDLLTELDW